MWKIVTELLLGLLRVMMKISVCVKMHGKMMFISIFKLLVEEKKLRICFIWVTKMRKHKQKVCQKENQFEINIETFF